MEFEGMSEEMRWESDRIAAAFQMKNWERGQCIEAVHLTWQEFYGYCFEAQIRWEIEVGGNRLLGIDVGIDTEVCSLFFLHGREVERWKIHPCDPFNEIMVRGMYRMGIEDYQCEEPLPSLSAHEKLELRLSLPREFWPKTWVDEEGE